MILTRRSALYTGTAGLVALPALLGQAQQPATAAQNRPPALDPQLVREFVIAGHGDLAKTTKMLDQEPGLLNSAWDWGGGDFEMAIGGAGHMGRRDIAEFLISRGGRFDIFVAAMLGKVEIVKALLASYPNLAQSKGPHGIPLIVHAEKGGSHAKAVLEYLKSFKA